MSIENEQIRVGNKKLTAMGLTGILNFGTGSPVAKCPILPHPHKKKQCHWIPPANTSHGGCIFF